MDLGGTTFYNVTAFERGSPFVAPCDGRVTSITVITLGPGEGDLVVYDIGGGEPFVELGRGSFVTNASYGPLEVDIPGSVTVSAGGAYLFTFDDATVFAEAGPLNGGTSYYRSQSSSGAFTTELGSVLKHVIRFGPEGGDEPPAVMGFLAYGTCPAALPAGRFRCAVEASGTNNLTVGQRYTVFLRVAETGRIAFRGETKPEGLEDLTQDVRFRTVASDPAAFTLELVVEMGSVASPSGEALVIGSLAFTKGAGLRAAEALTVYPNPTASQATLRFAVAEQAEATLVVYDALGREVARPVEGAVSGVVEASFDGSDLPAGLYVARLTTAQGSETVRLSVVR